ncbi:MAG: restriction endonuclease [Blastocatellia bacterium]
MKKHPGKSTKTVRTRIESTAERSSGSRESFATKRQASQKSSKRSEGGPAWMQLEQFMTKLHKQLAPDAEVIHNFRVKGRSGITRKLDFAIVRKTGLVPILIPFDCKNHKRRICRADVATFDEQIDDVGANVGVMISTSGFDGGAKRSPQNKVYFLSSIVRGRIV